MSDPLQTPAQLSTLTDDNLRPTYLWWAWFQRIVQILNPGYGVSATVPLAKITGGGANGSLTFVNGIITTYTAPT